MHYYHYFHFHLLSFSLYSTLLYLTHYSLSLSLVLSLSLLAYIFSSLCFIHFPSFLYLSHFIHPLTFYFLLSPFSFCQCLYYFYYSVTIPFRFYFWTCLSRKNSFLPYFPIYPFCLSKDQRNILMSQSHLRVIQMILCHIIIIVLLGILPRLQNQKSGNRGKNSGTVALSIAFCWLDIGKEPLLGRLSRKITSLC